MPCASHRGASVYAISEFAGSEASFELALAEPVVVRGLRLVLSETSESEAAHEIDANEPRGT